MDSLILNDGHYIPRLGFGVFQIPAEETREAVINAIRAGYRHIDTAQAYLNEKEVGQGIADSGIPRKEIFVTTKIWLSNQGYEKTMTSFMASLQRLQLSYIDLVLVHQPYGDVYGTWRALEELQRRGLIKSIGVSNLPVDRVIDLAGFNKVVPAVNQIEVNPFYQRKQEIDLLQSEGIMVEAWAPFAEGKHQIFEHPVLKTIGKKYGKTVAQIIIRYFMEQDIIVLCKSTKYDRMVENLNVYDFFLTEDDKHTIAKLDRGETSFMKETDPTTVKRMIDTSKIEIGI